MLYLYLLNANFRSYMKLCFDDFLSYCLGQGEDRGLDKSRWKSFRLYSEVCTVAMKSF